MRCADLAPVATHTNAQPSGTHGHVDVNTGEPVNLRLNDTIEFQH